MSVFVVPVVALCIPMVVVPTALWLRHARIVREMEHAERMRALEVGVDLRPVAGLTWPGAAVCIALGAGVPVVTFALAIAAVILGEVEPPVFTVPLILGLGGIVAAWVLGNRLSSAPSAVDGRASAWPTAKPAHYDPDAFDVVGSRG